MLQYKPKILPLIGVIILFITFSMTSFACDETLKPSTKETKEAITKLLKSEVPVQISGHMGGGRDALLKELKIIEFGIQKGDGANLYWPVKVFFSGDCEVGSKRSKLIDPVKRKVIEGETVFYLSVDDFGKWKAKHKGF